MDAVVLGLLAVAVVPWLGSIFESVEAAGWKFTYRRLQEELDRTRDELEITKGEVASAHNRADFIESSGVTDLRPGPPREELRQLVQRYDSIRESMASGPPRTREMTDVVRHLTILAKDQEDFDDIDWLKYLKSSDGGKRIAAYSYYYARPRAEAAPWIAQSLISLEHTPFGQYWAIRALGAIANVFPGPVRNLSPELDGFLARLPPGTDRYYELSQIADSLA